MRKASVLCLIASLHLLPLSVAHSAPIAAGGAVIVMTAPKHSQIGSGDTVYVLPRADERIKDPLALYTTFTSCMNAKGPAKTLQELSKENVNSAAAVLLRVDRKQCGIDLSYVTLWFLYTYDSNLIPTKDLPPQEK